MMSSSDDEFVSQARSYVSFWFGIDPPNDLALRHATHIAALSRGLVNLRGNLEFGSEPSSFDAALKASKEQVTHDAR